MDGQDAFIALLGLRRWIGSVFELAWLAQIIPIDFQIIKPGAAEPILLATRLDIVCQASIGS